MHDASLQKQLRTVERICLFADRCKGLPISYKVYILHRITNVGEMCYVGEMTHHHVSRGGVRIRGLGRIWETGCIKKKMGV